MLTSNTSHVRAYLQLGLLRARLLPHVVPSIGNTLLVGQGGGVGGRRGGWQWQDA